MAVHKIIFENHQFNLTSETPCPPRSQFPQLLAQMGETSPGHFFVDSRNNTHFQRGTVFLEKKVR